MATIKRGTTPTLQVEIEGITSDDITKVEFLFKYQVKENAPEILKKTYPDDVSYSDGLFLLPLTESETRRFGCSACIYMDTRITLNDGSIPYTEIVSLSTADTMFKAIDT